MYAVCTKEKERTEGKLVRPCRGCAEMIYHDEDWRGPVVRNVIDGDVHPCRCP